MTTRILCNDETHHPIIHRSALTTWGLAILLAALVLVGMSGCATAQGDRTGDSAQLGASESASSQKTPYDGQRVQLKAKHSGKCAEIIQGDLDGMALLIQSKCKEQKRHQIFTLHKQNDDSWTISAEHSGMCLEASSKWNGENVRQHSCRPNIEIKGQRFLISGSEDRGYFIQRRNDEHKDNQHKDNPRCFHVPGSFKKDGTIIIMWPCDRKKENQRFELLELKKL